MRLHKLHNKESQGFSVAITDLPMELQQLRAGCVYWLSVCQHADARLLCAQILGSMQAGSRAIVVSQDTLSDVLSDLPAELGPEDLRFYRIAGQAKRTLNSLTQDLDRSLRARRRLVLLVLPLDYLPEQQDVLLPLLKTWVAWADRTGCALLVLACGQPTAQCTAQLQMMNHVLSGAARLDQLSGGYRYQVLHWRNALDATGLTDIPLQKTADGFKALAPRVMPIRLITDEHKFLLDQKVLEGAPVLMAEHWQIAHDWEALFDQALSANAATVVFGLHDAATITVLARLLHILRKQRGPSLKLVVREMCRVLRGQDEQLLLACGATVVIPSGTHLSRFLSLLESVQGQRFSHDLADDPDEWFQISRKPKLKGVVSIEVFTEYLDMAIQHMQTPVAYGMLLVLSPARGVSAQQALSQACLRRSGDVACEINGEVYVFLFACQSNFLELALKYIFRLPFQELFQGHQLYGDALEVSEQNTLFKRQLMMSKSKARTDLKSVVVFMSGQHVMVSQKNNQDAKRVFQPFLQPLEL